MAKPIAPPAYHGTRQPVRDLIGETLWGASIYCETRQRYASLGDDAGLRYAVRCLEACARTARSCLAELDKAHEKGARHD